MLADGRRRREDAQPPTARTPLMVAAGLGMWYVGEDGGSLPGQEDEVLEAVKMCVALGNDVNGRNEAGRDAAARRRVPRRERSRRVPGRERRQCSTRATAAAGHRSRSPTGSAYGDVYKQQPQTAEAPREADDARVACRPRARSADGTECLDCVQTHSDQARAALERDRKMEAEFAKSEAERLASRRQ